MTYRVHRLNIRLDKEPQLLESFLNELDGEIISIIPNVKPTFLPMGATARVDFLLIVEKLKTP